MIHLRPGASDERVLEEVITRRCYRRTSANFDLEKGERWLDLGANIGAFALYCAQRGAVATCYEPDEENFKLLEKNVPQFELNRKAVIAENVKEVKWFTARNSSTHSRNSIVEKRSLQPVGFVPSFYAKNFTKLKFNGVKMDIEGAEGAILDNWFLPTCKKLVLEYHTSRDSSVKNLASRIANIQNHFKQTAIPPEFLRAIARKDREFKSFFDRLIFAWEPYEN